MEFLPFRFGEATSGQVFYFTHVDVLAPRPLVALGENRSPFRAVSLHKRHVESRFKT